LAEHDVYKAEGSGSNPQMNPFLLQKPRNA